MSINLAMEGGNDLSVALKGYAKLIPAAVVDEIQDSMIEYERELKATMQKGQGTGRIYQRKNHVHQASAAGESPVSDTGRGAGSIQTEFLPNGASTGSNLAYMYYLEFGTRHMARRPMWLPASERLVTQLKARLEQRIAKVI